MFSFNEEFVSKTSYIHFWHVTHLHYWLPLAIKIVRLIKCVTIVGNFHLTYSTMFTKWLKVIKKGIEWHTGVDRRAFGIKQDFIPLFFFMYVQNLWQGLKAVLTIVEFEFFDIVYSKFQLVPRFSICSKFCVENWLLCCDLSCKWVTCRSGCQKFGNELFKYSPISIRKV